MNLCSLIPLILFYLTNAYGSNDFYFITTPNSLISDTPHEFNVQTSIDLMIMIETIHISSNITHRSPVYVVNRGYESIPYYVPFVGKHIGSTIKLNFLGDICLNLKKCQTSKIVVGNFINNTYELGLISNNFIIFAETDKPIYKPGEKIQLRFMPIYPTNLMREPKSVGKQWEITLNSDGKYEMVKAVHNKMSKRSFELIFIENPDGVRVAQWNNVDLQSSMQLQYQLTNDPVFGVWKCTAVFEGQNEVIEYTVKKYVLPRFVVDVVPPSEILASDNKVKFKVCAKYSTGKTMPALIQGSFCLKFNSKNMDCRTFVSTMKNRDCAKISVKFNGTGGLIPQKYQYYNTKTTINVTVTENGTTSSVTKVIDGGQVKSNAYEIKFESKNYFKPGLPYFGRVRLLRHSKKPQKNTTVSISVTGWDYTDNWGFNKNYTSDKAGFIEFVIPYIPVESSITVNINGDESKLKSPMTNPYIYQTLENWDSVDKQYLQIQPITDSIKCPGTLDLVILTNYDISSIDMYAQIFSRGQITDINRYPPVPVKCDARNDYLGHYMCKKDGRLICKSGWKGDNCREPICGGGCVNGACVEPNKCICKMGWAGNSCDTCVKASYCQNGFCKYGNDCQCYQGYQNYDCSKKGPRIHNYYSEPTIKPPVTTPSVTKKYEKQTIFERIIDIPISKQMGPDVHIVVYFITPGREVVADAIEISSGLNNCSHLGGGKFEFDQEISLPKSKVVLTMDPGMKNTSCAVRIADIALSQFGKSSNVDLSYLVRKLIDLNHKITVDNSMGIYRQQPCLPNKRKKRMIWPAYHNGIDSSKVLTLSGFTAITNARIINVKCRYRNMIFYAKGASPDMEMRMNMVEQDMPMKSEKLGTNKNDEKSKIKKQIREHFPESWLFDYFNKTTKHLNLIVPDSMTTWKADAYCMTEKGIWIAPSRTLKVFMPFFVDIYVPYSIKLGEQLGLPVKLFNYANVCYEINVQINVNAKEIKIIGLKAFTLCVCANDEKTVYFNIKPKVIGKLNITVDATSKYSDFCSDKKQNKTKIEMSDAIRRQLLVEPRGVPTETTFSELICNKNEQLGIVELFKIPSKIVAGSLRSYLTFNGDVMGQTFDNLDKMVKMPYGCGEQNMVAVVPSIYVLEYLNALKIDNPALAGKAREYIIEGYSRQLNYKHPNGSFSAFGKTDKFGSTWLTSFVLRSFSDASKYVNIDKKVLLEASLFLQDMQSQNGCFKEQGKLISSAMAGGVQTNDNTDESLLTAYVLISIKNVNITDSKFDINKALQCIRSGLAANPSNYRLALTAYVFALYERDSQYTNSVISQLLERSVKSGRYQYWPFNRVSFEEEKINAADIETTGYAFLALKNHQSLSESLKTVYWLSNQRNSLGGYYSTQDTVVALNALSVFAETIGVSAIVSLNASIVLNSNKHYTDLITGENRLVSRTFNLGSENISYISIKTNGSGCVSVQLASLYNIDKLYSANDTFKLSVKSIVASPKECDKRQLNVCFAYLRRDKNSNMILLTIDYPSGWQLPNNELERLRQQIVTPLNRIDFQDSRMELYYDAFSYHDAEKELCFQFQLEEKSKISNLKPAIVRIVDYYNPQVYTDASYTIVDKMCNQNETVVVEQPKVISCPKCFDHSEESTLKFMNMICQSWLSGLVTATNGNPVKERIFYQPMQSSYYEWTLDLEPVNCSCLTTWPSINKDFVILSKNWMSLEDKFVFTNDSDMFPLQTMIEAFKFDLRNQCYEANNLYSMMGRVNTKFLAETVEDNSCATCIPGERYYFIIKNITEWVCSNYSHWQFNVTSVSTEIKGVLSQNNVFVHVEAKFPSNLCYCNNEMTDRKKAFRIVDLYKTITSIGNKPNDPLKLLLDSRFQVVEESVFEMTSYIKCSE